MPMIPNSNDDLSVLGERGIISEMISPLLTETHGNILLDDCAVFETEGISRLLFTADQGPTQSFMELLGVGTPSDLAHFHVTMNVSDIAAMGGRPIGMLLVLALTRGDRIQYLREYLHGIKEAMTEYEICLFGGDTKQARVRATTITMVGQASSAGLLRRSGARPGDSVFVVGPPVGTAIASFIQAARDKSKGIRTDVFRPRALVSAGRQLVESGICSSCMDMSDGLLASAEQLANASGVTFRIDVDRIPFAGSPSRNHSAGWKNLVTNVGGDFGLMFTTKPVDSPILREIGATLIGTVDFRGRDDQGISQAELERSGIALKVWEQFRTVGSISDELQALVSA